ncbi:sigma-70 family RNA polymerase sigma factor [Saccharopolyspora rhizosphaerae]|uniref:Sigma-70 family RNA polymerase sigma factor n=1 Tax=Saccharopolyspora rhizosphaerae TaxID=2492662 RepID=A0A3R8QNE9_9PSEU|nr:sigma-70 family RNA polymerase sigma factor [Saccharopolyspora rhizosphaerae]RRO16203.1 sigma-70 family RNA polymerase sigma factor [Saccharopolyspora rhizosphaerae]
MDEEFLAKQFEQHRKRLAAVALRMLGSHAEAEDAVQEAWLRVSRAGTDEVSNLGGWLTTVVGRICLDVLRSRRSRPESPAEDLPEPSEGPTPETEAVMADSVGLALFVVLDALEPAERLAFVLHDMFAVPFDDIAAIVGRSPSATRQLASRARRRVRRERSEPDLVAQREVVDAFLRAAREGDFEGLLTVLDPDVVLRADQRAVDAAARARKAGAPALTTESRGAELVARAFQGGAKLARPALVADAIGAAYAPRGKAHSVFLMTIRAGRITEIEVIAERDHLTELDPVVLD